QPCIHQPSARAIAPSAAGALPRVAVSRPEHWKGGRSMNVPKQTLYYPAKAAPGAARQSLALRRGRRMSRSAWVLFVWSLGLYVVSGAGWGLVWKDWHATVSSGGRQKLQRLQRLVAREPDRPLLVMLGSSRTDGLFAARRFDGLPAPDGRPFVAYNFGVPM